MKELKIYQGEPAGFLLTKKDGAVYVPSFEGYELEAALSDGYGKIVKKWSTGAGTITIGTMQKEGQTAAYAACDTLAGSETAEMAPGHYDFNLARVIEDGRAIGLARCVLCVERSIMSKGL